MNVEELSELWKKRTLNKNERDINYEENSKSRKDIFLETGKVKLFPTDISFFYEVNNIKIIEGSCLRKLYYQFFEVEPTDPISIEVQEIFEMGIRIEEIIKEELINLNLLKEENTEVEAKIEFGDIILSGRIDAILNDGTLIEIKSHKHHDFLANKLKKGEMIEYHYSQVACYLAIEKIKNPTVDPKLIIIYKNKNNEETNFIEVKLDNNGYLNVNGNKIEKFNFSSAVKRMKEFVYYLKNNELPPKDYGYYKDLPKNKLNVLANLKKINTWDLKELEQNKNSQACFFECKSCGYKSMCLNLD